MNWEVRAMRSATPFFDSALYKKTMARFWPLWAGWTVLLTFLFPVQLVNRYFNGVREGRGDMLLSDSVLTLPESVSALAVLQLMLCVLCAMAAFSYLYNNRSAYMMHALPMRREKLFGTQYLAGLSMVILPELLTAVLEAPLQLALLPSESWGAGMENLGIWLLAVLAQAVAFYSIAVFCAMFTGHILALPVFYGVVNFLAMGVYGLVQELAYMFLYGFSPSGMSSEWIVRLTPGIAIAEASGWDEYWENGKQLGYRFTSAKTLAAYALVGVVLTVLALLIYRRRHVETAGDVVAIRVVRPLFRWGVALCGGLFLGTFTGALLGFDHSRVFLCIMVVLWTVAGYFGAEMLLKKSFHVFKNRWKEASVLTVLVALLCASCYFDWLGLETRVPELDQVAFISGTVDMGVPWDSGQELILGRPDEPETVREKVLELHRAVVADLEKNGRHSHMETEDDADGRFSVNLHYTLKNGTSMSRRYYLPIYEKDMKKEGTLSYAIQRFQSDRELVERAYNFSSYEGSSVSIMSVELDYVDIPNSDQGTLVLDELTGTQRTALWKAVRQDFDEGNIGTRWLEGNSPERRANTYRTDLRFVFQTAPEEDAACMPDTGEPMTQDYDRAFTITLTPQASHTLELLGEYGVWDQCQLMTWD